MSSLKDGWKEGTIQDMFGDAPKTYFRNIKS